MTTPMTYYDVTTDRIEDAGPRIRLTYYAYARRDGSAGFGLSVPAGTTAALGDCADYGAARVAASTLADIAASLIDGRVARRVV